MTIEKIKNRLAKDNKVVFKLYSLEYIIEIINNNIQIYPLSYPTDIKIYNTLEDLLNNFRVYNESLVDAEDRIVVYE